MRHAVSLAVVLCLAVGSLSAATLLPMSDAELLGRSRLVVVGTVVDSVAREAAGRDIYTDTRLRIEEIVKGQISTDTVTVTEFGGLANGHGIAVPGSASYQPGTRVLAFLRQRDDGTYFTASMSLGKYRFTQRDGIELLVRDADGVEVDDANAFAATTRPSTGPTQCSPRRARARAPSAAWCTCSAPGQASSSRTLVMSTSSI